MPPPEKRGGLVWIALILLLLLPPTGTRASAFATAQVTLAWDPNVEPAVVGYRLRYGPSSGDHPFQIDAGNATSAKIKGLAFQTVYYAVVTAYTEDGAESEPSRELQFLTGAPPDPPGIEFAGGGNLLRIRVTGAVGTTVRLETSGDLLTWHPLTEHTINGLYDIVFVQRTPASRRRFFRVAPD